MSPIPVARPLMPPAEALLPYLRRVDANRTYTNFGPLVTELETRLARRLDISPECIVTVSNATVGLTLALQAVAKGQSGICLIPAWTFVATAHAVVAAGLEPVLLDVDEQTWAITPDAVHAAISKVEGRVAAVMVVAPFGAPLDVNVWDEFTATTGIPTIVDAAAAHDTVQVGYSPSVVSLHATKVLGAGEGGYVVSRDPRLIVDVKKRSNFGFYGSRNAQVEAQNGKLSEYHAAVGLASMDCYGDTVGRFKRIAQQYRSTLHARGYAELQEGFGESWIGSVCVVRFRHRDQQAIAKSLSTKGIDSRAWWGDGIHNQSAFQNLKRFDVSTTDRLSKETLGLPFFVDMTCSEVDAVAEQVIFGLESSTS